MTAKDRAEELIQKFDLLDDEWDTYHYVHNSKECAMILVNEMLGNAAMIWGGRNTETGLTARDEFRNYWNEVKNELEKL